MKFPISPAPKNASNMTLDVICHKSMLQPSQSFRVIPREITWDGRISQSSAMEPETSSLIAWKRSFIPKMMYSLMQICPFL